ncbi:Fur-regulated basic protein FbpC [Bacillus licheniformis]|nr:Fur-regulated basic protein FbpC [Bacillus licheniformis]MDH3163939.1 Fur-regulated basic protein FbpC [Bacillus licheniformis]MED4409742.1 Fur-regulated basic protein FbpC [Bacillus licheniformis]QDL79461.1 Fur-regulated basic protein FbpC [Bacillus licheniformis]
MTMFFLLAAVSTYSLLIGYVLKGIAGANLQK